MSVHGVWYPVVNFGGEGEVKGALNVNTFEEDWLRRPRKSIEQSGPFLEADMRDVPLPSGCTDEVVGNKLPMQATHEWAGQICQEAYRLLRSGGRVRFNSETGGGQGWLPWLHRAGFSNVREEGPYAVGEKE